MKANVYPALDTSLPDGEYKIQVYDIDPYGAESENYAQGTINLKK